MTSQDLLFTVLAVSIIFLTIPLMLILWRTYKMMTRVEKLLDYAEHIRGLAMKFENMSVGFIESTLGKFTSKK